MSDSIEMQRPPEAVPITKDGALHKLVLHEGTGELPPKHARCLVHYVGRLAESGEVFIDTRQESPTQEPEELVAGRDATYREVGLNLAAATMRRGERCRLWAPPAYGYGDRGSFSFPTVPPGAHLVYDLELLDWEDPEEERDRASLTYEERLEAAERRRQDGNALYGEGRYAEAERKYRLAVSYINEDLLIQLGDFHFDKAVAVRRPAQLNIAACQLRLGDLHGAVATCSEVLAEDGGNAKALFRRGKARAALGQGDAALADLAKAAAAAPEDVGIARELAAVRRTLKQEKAASGRLFKGYFDKPEAAASAPLYEEQQPLFQAAAASSQPAGVQQQQRRRRRGSGMGLMAALQSVWAWLMRALRTLLPFFF